MTIKVQMHPNPANLGHASDGISQVVKHYARHLPRFGVEVLPPGDESHDLLVAHAGAIGAVCQVSHVHGLMWHENDPSDSDHSTNAKVIASLRAARQVTVPSPWVAEPIMRDMRLVRFRKEGRHVYYALDDEHIETLFQCGLDHVEHD